MLDAVAMLFHVLAKSLQRVVIGIICHVHAPRRWRTFRRRRPCPPLRRCCWTFGIVSVRTLAMSARICRQERSNADAADIVVVRSKGALVRVAVHRPLSAAAIAFENPVRDVAVRLQGVAARAFQISQGRG